MKSAFRYCVDKTGEALPKIHGVQLSLVADGIASLCYLLLGDRLKQYSNATKTQPVQQLTIDIKKDEINVVVEEESPATTVEAELDAEVSEVGEEGHTLPLPTPLKHFS